MYCRYIHVIVYHPPSDRDRLILSFSLREAPVSTVLLAECSGCLTTNHEVAGSISGISTILNMDYVWNGVHLAS